MCQRPAVVTPDAGDPGGAGIIPALATPRRVVQGGFSGVPRTDGGSGGEGCGVWMWRVTSRGCRGNWRNQGFRGIGFFFSVSFSLLGDLAYCLPPQFLKLQVQR
ncbi:uncharacterized protein LAESUDRAFT_729526, partial [Laetiporus sulphureus 93-53]